MDKKYSKRSMIRFYSFVMAGFLVLGGTSALAINDSIYYRKQLEINYMRSLGNLGNYSSSITNTLTKGIYSATPTQLSLLSAALWRDSAGAKQALSEIPLVEEKLEGAYRFYSQVGDYAMSLSKKSQSNPNLTKQDISNLEMLLEYSQTIGGSLQSLEQHVRNGKINIMQQNFKIGTSIPQIETEATGFMSDIEQIKSYATLVYDGPFSDHMLRIAPRLTKNLPEIERDTAKEIANSVVQYADILSLVKKYNDPTVQESSYSSSNITTNPYGEDRYAKDAKGEDYPTSSDYNWAQWKEQWDNDLNAKSISTSGLKATDDENSIMPLFCYEYNGKYIGITKNGGIPTYYTNSREVSEGTLDAESCINIAESFLTSMGFKSMKNTYYEKVGGILTINFAYEKDDVVFYPDLIKVGIATDTGEVVFMDARTYITNHYNRNLPEGIISKSSAVSTVGSLVKVTDVSMAVIPTSGSSEVYCYEIKATGNKGHQLLIYVNALTGVEEQLLILIQTAGGILTM